MSETLSTWVHGCSGKTGRFVSQSFSESKEFRFVGGSGRTIYCEKLVQTPNKSEVKTLVDQFTAKKVELIIDFSGADGNLLLLDALELAGAAGPSNVLVASTGLSEESNSRWNKLSANKKILFAPNTSVGILVMKSLLKKAIPTLSKLGFDMDVREAHHIHKLDSPSGTTKSLLKEYKQAGIEQNKVQVHVERRGGVFGLHSSLFTSAFEEISISHQAFSRKLFGEGSVMLANWLKTQPNGAYTLEDVETSLFGS